MTEASGSKKSSAVRLKAEQLVENMPPLSDAQAEALMTPLSGAQAETLAGMAGALAMGYRDGRADPNVRRHDGDVWVDYSMPEPSDYNATDARVTREALARFAEEAPDGAPDLQHNAFLPWTEYVDDD